MYNQASSILSNKGLKSAKIFGYLFNSCVKSMIPSEKG